MRLAAVVLPLLVAAAALPAPSPVAAQSKPSAPSGKVGVVNTAIVMRDAKASQQAQKDLEAEFKRREAEILKGPKDQVERRRAALQEDMAQRRDERLAQIVEKANQAIKRIAEAENFDAVFFEAAYAAERIDLTQKVIKALDSAK